MCGIAGLFGTPHALAPQGIAGALSAMTDAIIHRGPDAGGHWIDEAACIALGHRRLSIIDLSPAGAQPMTSHSGRYVIVFNGEIYNFADLRASLESRHGAIEWRGHSDTEVLLEAIARDGLRETLARCDGMFALAIFDRQERRLSLARDAFGEKPLYYGLWRGGLIFASELKAVEALPGFSGEIDLHALGDYFKYSCIPGPQTIWRGFRKLPPAHILTLTLPDAEQGVLPAPLPWWDREGEALAAHGRPFTGTAAEAAGLAGDLLAASTRRRMVADVPLGALLSGGIDSTMVTALMQAHSTRPVRTFSIGVDEPGFDEAPAAAAVARHLGTDHAELILSPGEVQDAIPAIAAIHDEPFADSSQVPTWLVARMAREHVTVVLSGDGGDEIFGGYNRHVHAPGLWRRVARLPLPLRSAAAGLLASLPAGALNGAVALAGPLAPRELKAGRAAEKMHKLARVLAMADETSFHDRLLATADDPAGLLLEDVRPRILPETLDARAAALPFAERAMLLDTACYLPDDVLTKVDRASMAVSLETRTPYLDRELFRFAWSLPPAMRHSGGGDGKALLRQMLYARVPRALVDRPKAGFAIPVGRWLRTGLRDWVESELSVGALARSGLLDIGTIRKRWQEHLAGARDHETLLWNVLMFQAWQGRQRG